MTNILPVLYEYRCKISRNFPTVDIIIQKIEFLLLAVPRRLFCFGSLVILDVVRCYLWLFTLYINIKISKNSC